MSCLPYTIFEKRLQAKARNSSKKISPGTEETRRSKIRSERDLSLDSVHLQKFL